MARNKLNDLRNHLFAQLERLEDENLDQEQIDLEIKRTKAINSIAVQIIDTAKVELDLMKIVDASEESAFFKDTNQQQIS